MAHLPYVRESVEARAGEPFVSCSASPRLCPFSKFTILIVPHTNDVQYRLAQPLQAGTEKKQVKPRRRMLWSTASAS